MVILLVWAAVRKSGGNIVQLALGNWRRAFFVGLAAGCGLLLFSLFSERLSMTLFSLEPSPHPLAAAAAQAATWRDLLPTLLLGGLAAPVSEEMLYRLYTFPPLARRWGIGIGALLSSGIFALMHFNLFWLGETLVVGMGLALLYYYSRSLVSSIVAHSFINTSKLLLIYFGLT